MDNKINDKQKKIKGIIELLLCFAIATIIAFVVLNFIAQRFVISGSSMYPTLEDNDNVVVSKLYNTDNAERFDVIVFKYNDPIKGEVSYVKRIIGLPGEMIQIVDGKIYITNSEGRTVLEENYGYYSGDTPMNGYDASEPIQIGDNEFFVLGDNRNGSTDSRKIGCISADKITGKVVFRILPFDSIGGIN